MQKFLYLIISISLLIPGSVFAASETPSVESKLAKNITYNSASIYGLVSPGTAEDNGYWFEWGVVGTDDVASFKTARRNVYIKSGQKQVSTSIKGLSPNTQYYFRICADNQKTEVCANTIFFTTRKLDEQTESVVVATTRNVINIKEESAKVFGYISPLSGTAKYWFEFGTDEKMDMTTSVRSASRSGGEVSVSLTNLTSGTTYYYRVAAENESGVVFGTTKSFKTKGVKPVVEAKSETQVVKASTKKADSKVATNTSGSSIIDKLFGRSSSAKDTVSDSSKTNMTGAVISADKNVLVEIKSSGKPTMGETVKYDITYKYNNKEAGNNAELQIVLPKTVKYAGDTTKDELLLSTSKTGSDTFILPIGNIKKGDSRTISIIGVINGKTTKIPEISVKLVADTKSGKILGTGVLAAAVKSKSTASGTTLGVPTTGIIWFVVLNLIVIALILMVKAKESYALAKARIAETNTKKNEIEKEIKETLIQDEKKEEVVPHFNPEVLHHTSPNNNVIPVKPKIADEYKSSNVGEIGLPGMEVI